MKKDIRTTPQSMNMNVMQKMLFSIIQCSTSFYYTKEFAISSGADLFSKILEVSDGGPFLVEDYRMGVLVKGEMDVTVNLIDYHVTAGQMVFVGRGSIAHLHRVSKETIVKGFILSADLMSLIFPDKHLSLSSRSATAFLHEATIDDRKFLDNILITTWSLVHSKGYPEEVFHSLISALVNYYDHLYRSVNHLQVEGKGNENLFNKFIALINQHCDRERNVPFYADKLCLSPRYFSTLIQEQSGKPAKHWIDIAVVTRAKVLLRHSPKTISQISTELNFPNDSFFCKFFRRLTGCSPTEYKEQG
uniref:HTH araC/xylS-type domain-containing protein n=1 Tax=uncultured bacterium fosmid pJB69A5 TaxID=1478067 RepID=A0A0H3U9R7_9BACT|nr:hypothetical protein [uncultured bacterium fosmid pJB69A5]